MKHLLSLLLYLLICACTFFFSTQVNAQGGAQDIYKKAVYAEKVTGDLGQAIGLYQDIIENYSKNREIAAMAMYRLGISHEKMGMNKAIQYYQKLLSEYSDQSEVAGQARQRLSKLQKTVIEEPASKEMSQRIVWKDGDNFGSPSPDGTLFSHVHWPTGNMKISSMKDGSYSEFTDNGNWGDAFRYGDISIWSPDGKKIAYYWIEEKNTVSLNIYDRETKKTERIMEAQRRADKDVIWPTDWSKDGRYILGDLVVYKNREESEDHLDVVAMYDLKEKKVVELITLEDGAHGHFASFSPDGKRVVYSEDNGKGTSFIRSIDIASGKTETLVSHNSNNKYPQIMSDNKTMLFFSDRSGSKALWKMDLTSNSDPVILSQLGNEVQPLRLINDQLYFGKDVPTSSVYEVSVDFETGKLTSDPKKINQQYEGLNNDPLYSPDGSKIAYFSSRSVIGKSNVIVVKDLATGEEKTYGGGLPVQNRFWTPPRFIPGKNAISVRARIAEADENRFDIDLETGEISTSSLRGDCWCSMDKDGTAYSEMEREEGGSNILAINPSNGESKIVYSSDESLRLPTLSPDGKKLAFFALDDDKKDVLWAKSIMILDLETKNLQQFQKEDGRFLRLRFAFSADGTRFIYADTDGEKTRFMIQPLDGKPAYTLGDVEFKNEDAPRTVAVHPDGKKMTFSMGGNRTEVWVLEGIQ